MREEYDYVSREALVEDIREDIRVAQRSLARGAYAVFEGDAWLLGEGVEDEGRGQLGGEEAAGGRSVGQKDHVGVARAQ